VATLFTSVAAEPNVCTVREFQVNERAAASTAAKMLPGWFKKFVRANPQIDAYDLSRPAICTVIQTDCGNKKLRVILARFVGKGKKDVAPAFLQLELQSEKPFKVKILGGGWDLASPDTLAARYHQADCD
jgi:hypothetical protein